MVIEVSQFKLVPGADESRFLEAAETSQREFLAQQPGFISRELLRGDDGAWLDMVRFESAEAARDAFAAFAGHPGAREFEQMLDFATVKASHWSPVRSW